ncbi:MAG: DUF3276 family protein [Treponema sp.]|jgi:hypothetical protein|nr:DUF3276 family protein [Treponema sp.]
MGIRGELFTTQVTLDNRSYFFNVKENRNKDVFLQIVESKVKDGEDDRRAIVVFADDMPEFFAGLDDALGFIEKDRKEKAKARAEKKAKKEAMYSKSANSDDGDSKKSKMRVYRRKGESRLVSAKRAEKQGAEGGKSVRPHVVSKRTPQSDNSEEY